MTAAVLESTTVTLQSVSVQIAGTDVQSIEPDTTTVTAKDFLMAALNNEPSLTVADVQHLSPVINGASATLETPVPEGATLGFMPMVQNG